MSFVDKFKKILFDDVDESEELPERTSKTKKNDRNDHQGFIDYHSQEEEDENPIREIKIPKEEKVEEPRVEEQINKFRFPDVSDFEKEIPTRTRNYDEMNLDVFDNEPDDEIKLVKEVNSFTTKAPTKQKKEKEVKDYRKMLSSEETPAKEKKPFTNTPVISPVWGILDKNYKPEEIVTRTEALTKVNTGAVPRSYGPVSYNDDPLITGKKKTVSEVKQDKKKQELIELNTAITDLINEPIEETKKEIREVRKVERKEEKVVPTHSLDDIDDEIIQTDNYDDIKDIATKYEDNSIERDNSGNNNIEDAFESTGEFDSIREHDSLSEEKTNEDEEELVDLASIVNKDEDDNDEDDSGLDNTIETDLFNLIDSMYKDEDE